MIEEEVKEFKWKEKPDNVQDERLYRASYWDENIGWVTMLDSVVVEK